MTAYSEFYLPSGEPRPHVVPLLRFFQGEGGLAQSTLSTSLKKLRQSLQSRLREQEVSYNILGAPDGTGRHWIVDEVPHLLQASEFERLEQGIKTRAHLLEACLHDIYGRQRLLREGVIPQELVQGNPHYFRTLHEVSPLGRHRLVLYAIDVVKAPDGSYFVHSDRTGSPAGAGYALENRLAVGQVLAAPFREMRVRKVNRFFEVMRQSLEAIAPDTTRAPRVVLLTPGVQDESSFEHGYLARYQGFELVEGRDLTVRGNEVFLKTLEGLKKVDVIMRRIFDDWCDPLELREDSLLGVSGLVGAARAGKVGIINPLGSAVVESPAFRAYTHDIALTLGLGTDFLPSVPTRYLGDPRHRKEVLSNPDAWIFRPAFYDRKGAGKTMASLAKAEREALLERVRAEPDSYVAEQWPEASRVPVSIETGQEGSLSLRLFACRGVGGEFVLMPGGLGRVEDDRDGIFLSTQEGRTSKDVWVLGGAEAVKPSLPRMPGAPLQVRRGGIDVPSRLFDDVFWLGRYTERASGTARIIRIGLSAILEDGLEVPQSLSDTLVSALTELQVLTPGGKKGAPFEATLLGAAFDSKNEGSIRSCMARVHALTTATRSRLSSDTWSVLRRASGLFEPDYLVRENATDALEHLDDLVILLAAFRGNTSSNMVRGYIWNFLELGRRIEHAVIVLTVVKHIFKKGESSALMEILLRICDSQLTYRSRYLSALQTTPVVDLVLTDDTNPQSVIFQVKSLLRSVRALPQDRPFPLTRAEQALIRLEASLMTTDLTRVSANKAEPLQEIAEEGVQLLWQVSDELTRTYFTHATRSHAVSPNPWEEPRLETDS